MISVVQIIYFMSAAAAVQKQLSTVLVNEQYMYKNRIAVNVSININLNVIVINDFKS